VNSNTNPVTVLIVDDHLQFRKALRQALEIEDDIQVVGEADDWHTLVQGLHSSHPDVVLMDLNMRFSGEITSGIEATRRISSNYPFSAVIIITMHAERQYQAMARQAGARAYILKDSGTRKLLRAIREVADKSRMHDTPPVGIPGTYHNI